MQLNSFTVIDRHNRPTTMQRVALRTFFINDGVQVDPYAISAVSIFKKSEVGSTMLIQSGTEMGLVKGTPLMQFANINFGVSPNITVSSPSNALFAESKYDPTGAGNCGAGVCNTVSGIYKASGADGEFVVVLDGGIGLSGVQVNEAIIKNGASAVEDYIDVWTVKLSSDSDWQVLINEFSLFGDTFFTTTQPMIFQARNSLATKHIQLGSTINIKVPTEITVENKDIDSSLTNIFKQTAITSPTLEIVKLNDDVSLPSRVNVVTFAESDGAVEVTSDNTILYKWDTTTLPVEGAGPATGTYTVQVKYTLVDQTILSPRFPLIVS